MVLGGDGHTTSLRRYQPPECEIHLAINEFLSDYKGSRWSATHDKWKPV
jgi:hypothetical protein